jgi:glycosyltransferase involved in cell wall biosynthesis
MTDLKPLRVLINALSARLGGGQTYVANLLESFPADAIEVFLLAPESLKLPRDGRRVTKIPVNWPVGNPLIRALWEQIYLPGLITSLDANILFCPGGIVNTRVPIKCKTVTMSRNMIPFDEKQRQSYPLGYDRFRNWILKRLMLKSMKEADLVIFVSDCAKRVIERQCGPLKNTAVIPHGISPTFRPPQDGKPTHRSQTNGKSPQAPLPYRGKYFLYVSTIDFYKAQLEVVRAYGLLRQRRGTPEKLLLVGQEFPNYADRVRQEIARLRLQEQVVLTGMLPNDQLPSLYQNATINIFASECENCPNILLEALAAGRPTVVSNRDPMREIAADAAVYFDPKSPEQLADVLANVLADSERMSQLGRRAAERSMLYDWQRTGRQTWRAFERLSRN